MATSLKNGDAAGKLLVVPRCLEKLKEVGVKIYGAPFVRVLNKQGNEINDIWVIREYDRIVFASTRESRVTITKGDDAGKLMVLPRSFEELKWVGVKIYGASFVRVLTQKGNEINHIDEVKDDTRVVFASYKGDEESYKGDENAHSTAQKWVEEFNQPDKITCVAMLSEMINTYKYILFGK